MNPFIVFMASTAGRLVRIVAGILLIALGLLGMDGVAGAIVVVIGMVPLLAGIFDVCLFAPLFKNPLRGADIRGGAIAARDQA
ncbi:MAG TPA: YgaP-like transmembrane domain [Anaerolineales bacterium]|nr:YgaP-like transmembrane domain [Anaerolineales bacterium]